MTQREKATPFPKVRPIKPDIEDAPMRQSRYPTLPRLPARALLVAPSASGKTQTLIWMLMEGHKGPVCWQPSANRGSHAAWLIPEMHVK